MEHVKPTAHSENTYVQVDPFIHGFSIRSLLRPEKNLEN